ncbi:hypothetical protein FGO68_gene2819 [Halteria grandinella]|uniref:Uncharacterized protein n=1 Tax=Halteria grandinella TaxID=5974 RepID=A0A8J8SV19_HALGN|nr:hypothetical protein FGO68_gene2819 [Halteria grandinella]
MGPSNDCKIEEPSVLNHALQSDPLSRNLTQYVIDKSSITHRVGGRQVNLAVTLDNNTARQNPYDRVQEGELSHMDKRIRRQKSTQNPFRSRAANGLNLSIGAVTAKQRNGLHNLVDIVIRRDKEMNISEETDLMSSSRTGAGNTGTMLESKFERGGGKGGPYLFEIPTTIMEAESRSSKDTQQAYEKSNQ